jgi:hypothetical protein
MRLRTTSGLAMAAILATSFGFAGLTKAAPFAGMAAAVPAVPITQVQMTQEPSAAEAMPEKPRHHGYAHKGKMKMEEHHHHHHHHHHHRHAM